MCGEYHQRYNRILENAISLSIPAEEVLKIWGFGGFFVIFFFLHVAPGKRAVTEKDLPKDGVVYSLRAFPTRENDFGKPNVRLQTQ